MRFKLEKTRAFWLYIVGGLLGICVGIFLLPAWSDVDVFFNAWGSVSVKRIKRYANTTAQIVAIVELVLMAVLAVVCAVSSFIDMGRLGDPCQVFGIALWIRGASGVYTGYYCDSNIVKAAEEAKKAKKGAQAEEKKETKKELDTSEEPRGRVDDFTVWRLTLAIVLISLGTYLFIKPAFESLHLQWVFSCAIVAVSFFFVIFGFALKPRKVKVDELSPNGLTKTEEKSKKAEDTKGEKKDASSEENQKSLEGGKVSIKLDDSANAMTKTAVYDAVQDETALVVKEDK